MEFKEIRPIQSHIIEDGDGSLYRRNAEDDWEKLDDGENWIPVFAFLKELEKDFQEYLKLRENEQMSEKYNTLKGIPNPNAEWTGTPITDHTFTGIPPTTSSKTAYIPTVIILPPELKAGDKWYVKEPDQKILVVYEIFEVTEKTVVMKEENYVGCGHYRYRKSDIEFIEKVKE
jgi:hypothetical protein